jgi:hypothetical protein
MATVTLAANTDVSALSLSDGDTIDLAGFVLTFDVQPTVTGIQVTTPGTNGTCVFPVACAIPTWDFFAGSNTTAGMIGTLPANCEIGSITAGSITNSRGIQTNNGTVGLANAGSGSTAYGITTQNGIVGTANGGSGSTAVGILNNNGMVGTANGGSANQAFGVSTNNAKVGTANGGIGSSAHGISGNNGTVGAANGGSDPSAYGILFNNGLCLRLSDSVGSAVNTWRGNACFVEGPFIDGTIPSNIQTIYSLGQLSENATIAGDATVITLSEGTGTPGFTGIRAISRRLGT